MSHHDYDTIVIGITYVILIVKINMKYTYIYSLYYSYSSGSTD